MNSEDEDLPETEVRPALVWTCEECGIDNFEHCLVADMDDEEKEEIAEEMDVDPGEIESGDWVLYPEHVKCKECGSQYLTKDMHGPEDSEFPF